MAAVGAKIRAPCPSLSPAHHKAPRRALKVSAQAAALKDMSGLLTLDNIRSALIRQEDTIIFHLIERAQYATNESVYAEGAISVPAYDVSGRQYSLLEYAIRETEHVHGKLRRYTSPDEHAFFPESLPSLVMAPITFDPVLASYSKSININQKILQVYTKEVVPAICKPGDDNNYGSASMLDVFVLQALSKRIHYGMFVAEAKFREKTEQYTKLIKARDEAGIMELLTDIAVEDRVVQRVALKAATFGQELTGPAPAANSSGVKLKISPDAVGKLYRDWVMPLTKDVEVLYLLRRLEV